MSLTRFRGRILRGEWIWYFRDGRRSGGEMGVYGTNVKTTEGEQCTRPTLQNEEQGK